jgi:hypothetical protein
MQNKPNFRKAGMKLNFYSTKDYENKRLHRRGKNKAKQTRSEFIPKGAKIPTGELLAILKPGTNRTQFPSRKRAFLQISYHFSLKNKHTPQKAMPKTPQNSIFRQFHAAALLSRLNFLPFSLLQPRALRYVDRSDKKWFLAKKSPFQPGSQRFELQFFGYQADFLRPIRAKNYTNSGKKLLPFATLTISIIGLVVKINGCQS